MKRTIGLGVVVAVGFGACGGDLAPARAQELTPAAVKASLKDAAHERDAHVRDAAFTALTKAKTKDAIDALIAGGLRSSDSAIRRIAAEVLGVIEAPGVDAELLPLLESRDREVRVAAAMTAGLVKAPSTRPVLVKIVDEADDPLLRSVAVESVSRIGGDDAVALLDRWLASTSESVAASALHQYWWHDKARGAECVAAVLARPELREDGSLRPLLVQALEEAARYRKESCLGSLVELLSHPRARARDMACQTLRELTGLEIPNVADDWKEWWAHYGAKFRIPPKPGKRAASEQRSLAQFYGIPIVSDRIVFVIDYSGSMNETGTDQRPKIDGARDALGEVLSRLPDSTTFNLIAFSTQPRKWRDTLQKKSQATVDAAMQFARGTSPGGSTNVYDSLVEAITMEGVDTVVLLSDGAPSEGAYQYFSRIRYHLRLVNRTRKVAVSAIALYAQREADRESDTIDQAKRFLKELARESGGEYVER